VDRLNSYISVSILLHRHGCYSMRLKQIKLAGFKSFVDPTSFEVPGQLVGVVGPNGCGKSNIMDAVRWVLGESKASELRGESMQDVIFSGASDRKPASRASVELVFDNSLGRIGGSWGTYTEISVKRLLTRDGTSSYFINGQTVRRKDVHDIFLGTGLGPRAYAIIGQGMISKIIEAKPEDLRVFLEEAAGVSKYKERRKETEHRLSDTRENLTRVDDILRELNSQIEKLEKQAKVAQQYRELETEREQKQRMLWLLRREEAANEQFKIAALASAAQIALDAKISSVRSHETEIEQTRTQHYDASDEVHKLQAAFYDSNSEVAKIESEIRFVSESQNQLKERLVSLNSQFDAASQDSLQMSEQIELTEMEIEEALISGEELTARLADLQAKGPELDSKARVARERSELSRGDVQAIRSKIELSAAKQRAAQDALANLQRRKDRLAAEASLILVPEGDELETQRAVLEEALMTEHQAADSLASSEEKWAGFDAQRGPTASALRDSEAKLSHIEARLLALRQLQERVANQGKLNPWLGKHGLDKLNRLWQKLKIEAGWEVAVEAVLREMVNGLEVGRVDAISALASDSPPGKVVFFSNQATAAKAYADAGASLGLKPLAALVHSSDAQVQALIVDQLAGVYAANSMNEAMSHRDSLPVGGRFVLAAGHSVWRQAISLYAADSEQEGVLHRQHELENLVKEQRAQQMLTDEVRSTALRIEAAFSASLSALSSIREAHNLALKKTAVLRLDVQKAEQEQQRAALSKERLDSEIAEVNAEIQTQEALINVEGDSFEEMDMALAERQQNTEDLVTALLDAERELAGWREQERQLERNAQEASFKDRSLQLKLEQLKANKTQREQAAAFAKSEGSGIQLKLAELSDAPAQTLLQTALDAKTIAEQVLAAGRSRLDDLSQQLRSKDELRLQIEREQEPLRSRLNELMLKEQAARINAEQFELQLSEAAVDMEALAQALKAAFAEPPKPSWLQGEVTRLTHAVAALGPVNLAALDELTASTERKTFLDNQLADLNEAITTLEDAIKKIDKETRDLLQNTYDSVNSHFGRLFPELFGGGEARLSLTGDEILDAGITVIAQPPGKRNTSIHLLSGGEKALTAIALVFSLFQLNPAPFCLLDEVDAPLDDANTERYADMVRRMSTQTQFLFITHNKIAMEMAQQLIGVTMQERGVSRIVAVDLEAAAGFAQAA
jgi:chromosome segregation protein